MEPLPPHGRLGPRVMLLLSACFICFPGPIAWAQEPASETPGDTPIAANEISGDQERAAINQPITLEGVPSRAETTSAELATLLPHESSRRTLERVGEETDLALKEVESQLAKTRQMLTGRPNLRTLQRSTAGLSEMQNQVQLLEEELDDHLNGFGASLGRIDKIAAVWLATSEMAKAKEGADATILTRIDAVLGEIDQTRRAVVDRRNELLNVRDKLVNPSVALDENFERLQGTVEARLAAIFRAEHPPLWDPNIRESFQNEWQSIGPQLYTKQLEASEQVARKPHIRSASSLCCS